MQYKFIELINTENKSNSETEWKTIREKVEWDENRMCFK